MLSNFDLVLIGGDFNNRLNLSQEGYDSLSFEQRLQYDQHIEFCRIFELRDAGKITFPPTFKFGSDGNYVASHVPSYPDRICSRVTNRPEKSPLGNCVNSL